MKAKCLTLNSRRFEIGRRQIFCNIAVLLILAASVGYSTAAPTATAQSRDLAAMKAEQEAITPAQALELLRTGNERFVSGKTKPRDMLHDQRVTAAGQYPYAAILSCIDSRAPAEIIFGTGLGEIFNARVAGNIADEDIMGSMEFACKVAGSKVVLVMGHTACGAIKGAIDDVKLGNLTALLAKIRPAVEATQYTGERTAKNYAFVDAVARKNVELTIAKIREQSPVLRELESSGSIKIAGSMYNLETGVVDFLE